MRDARYKPKDAALSARQLLAQWITRHRMTQGEAADQIGVSRVKLNQYLHAEARPGLEMAVRIEDTTGIGLRLWLLDEPEDPVEAPVLVAVGNDIE
jgi:transcriptional regulator with XRE-family HTH domain